jgi:very-short-patch-repair endonuclease
MATKLNNLPYLKETRHQLRKNMTEGELVVWEVLKEKLCGRKFRRQHSIGYYIVLFHGSLRTQPWKDFKSIKT